MSLQQVCKIIKDNNRFLIAAHRDPEGDSLGSQLAMADILRQLGKEFIIVNADLPPARYHFIKGIGRIRQLEKRNYNFDVALVLDSPTPDRIGNVYEVVRHKPIVLIDHHVSNNSFGIINYVEPAASSAGEMVYGLIAPLGVTLNRDLATYIYIAMLTDTGGFRYSNTTSKTLRIAAELVECGVNPKQMYEKMFESHSLAGRKILGLCLQSLKVSSDGKIAWMRLTKAMFKKTKALASDAENFVNYGRFIDGAPGPKGTEPTVPP